MVGCLSVSPRSTCHGGRFVCVVIATVIRVDSTLPKTDSTASNCCIRKWYHDFMYYDLMAHQNFKCDLDV
jgi:hypothetical protein